MRPSVFPSTALVCAATIFVSGVWAANICDSWSSSVTYRAGDITLHDGHLWRASLPASVTRRSNAGTCNASRSGDWAVVSPPGPDDADTLLYCNGSSWKVTHPASFTLASKEPASDSPYWTQWSDQEKATLCQDVPALDTTNSSFGDSTAKPLGEVGKWNEEPKQTSRCELATATAVDDGETSCLLPEQFRNAKIHLPRNVTRISKSAFRLCPLAGKEARNVVVYVMDHSGSMSGSDRDPGGIAGTAFQQAMARQYELDSASFAGYIPFSGFVIGRNTIAPTRLDNGGLALVQSQVNADYDHKDGTNFYSPLSLARTWLSAPEFADYNKFIIFMADGEPFRDESAWGNDPAEFAQRVYQLLDSGDFPLIHTIYFGVPESQTGVDLMDSIAHLTHDAEGNKGQFRQLNTVEAMAAAMDTLVRASIKSSSPLELTVINKTTRDTVGVDQSRMKQLVDSTWISVMTSDLPVVAGKNSMELVGRYQNAGATAIPFTIYVDSTYNNVNSRIEGTPFTTSCHELTKLTILDEQAKNVFIFDQTDTVALVRFRPDDRSYGVSLEFSVLSMVTHDTLTVTAPLVSTPQGWLYQARVPLDWTGSALADARLQVADLDSFVVSWEHPDDPQDYIEATQRVLWQLARPDSVALHDVDHDGVLDELKLCFSHAVDSASLAPFRMEFAWIAANGTDTALVQWKDSQKNVSWSADSTCALWALDQSRYAPYTGIPQDDEDWMIHMVLPSQNPAWIDDLDGGAELVVDEMAPVILSANLHVNQTRSKPDTLRIQFSEPIDWNASGDGPLFDFQAGGLLFPALEYDEFSAGRSSFDILYYSGMDADFPVQNGDLVKMVVGDVRITDFAGNSAWKHNPWVTIAGGSHQNVKIVPEVVRVDGDIDSGDEWPQSDNGSKGAFSAIPYDNADEAFEAAKARGNIKVVWGPITFAEPALGEPAPKLSWSVWIFDNIGQYVDDYSGVLDCGAPEIAGRCYTEEGLAERFAWNFRDKHGRLVGAGVYRMRITIGDEVRNFEIGVVRAGK